MENFDQVKSEIITEILNRLKTWNPGVTFETSGNGMGGMFVIEGMKIAPFYFSKDNAWDRESRTYKGFITIRGHEYTVGRKSFKPLKSGGYNFDALTDYVVKTFTYELRQQKARENSEANYILAKPFKKYEAKGDSNEYSFSVNATSYSPESGGAILLNFSIRAILNTDQAREIVNKLFEAGFIQEKKEPVE